MSCNPFKGQKYGRSGGQRLRVWIGPYYEWLELSGLETVEAIYKGEAMLDDYGDTARKGQYVKIVLDEGPDGTKGVHPFQTHDVDKVTGEQMMASFWAIDDDESVIEPTRVEKRDPFFLMNEVKQANTVVRDPEFASFLFKRQHLLVGDADVGVEIAENPRKYAEAMTRLYLGVKSRSEMNGEDLNGLRARKRWAVLRNEYLASPEYALRQYSRKV
jgi:hypothetical protein